MRLPVNPRDWELRAGGAWLQMAVEPTPSLGCQPQNLVSVMDKNNVQALVPQLSVSAPKLTQMYKPVTWGWGVGRDFLWM